MDWHLPSCRAGNEQSNAHLVAQNENAGSRPEKTMTARDVTAFYLGNCLQIFRRFPYQTTQKTRDKEGKFLLEKIQSILWRWRPSSKNELPLMILDPPPPANCRKMSFLKKTSSFLRKVQFLEEKTAFSCRKNWHFPAAKCGALHKGPPFHGSRSSREMKIQNASCQMTKKSQTIWVRYFVRLCSNIPLEILLGIHTENTRNYLKWFALSKS